MSERLCRAIFKFGGAAVTDKGKETTLNEPALTALAEITGELHRGKPDDGIVIVHGAGSFGHQVASGHGLTDPNVPWDPTKRMGFCTTRLQVTELSGAVTKSLVDRGVPATAVSPGSAWRTESGAISASGQDQVRALLSSGVVPVLHGDCVPDASSGGTVLSGDALVRELAAGLRPEYVVFVTDVDGVMTRPPGEDGAEIMPEITVAEDGSWDIGSVQMTCAEHDATGGMRAKVQEAAAVARLGVPVLIVRWGSESCRRAMLAGPDACGDEGFRGTAVVPRRMSHAAAGAGSRERWQAATTLDRGMWGTPDVTWNVRGPNYLKDKKKVTAGQPAYQLVAVDLIRTPKDKPVKHVAPYLTWLPECPHGHLIVCNIVTPHGSGFLNLVVSWAERKPGSLQDGSKLSRMLNKFIEGSDAYRHSKFKLIPSIPNASWMIQSAVGNKPALLGKKLTMTYYKTDRYLEMCIDVKSSLAASTAVKLVSGSCSSFVVDLAILIESQSEDELPEEILGDVRLDHVDLTKAVELDPDTAPKHFVAFSTETPL